MESPACALERGLSNGWVIQIEPYQPWAHFTRGRSRKLCKLAASGIKYFTSLLGRASDEDDAGRRTPSGSWVTAEVK